MNKIPPKIREELSHDPFMKICCLRDSNCSGKIEWHHVIIFGGVQLQKKFAIVGACKDYHHRYANRKDIRELFEWIVLNRASEKELTEMSKAIDYKKKKEMLNKKFT